MSASSSATIQHLVDHPSSLIIAGLSQMGVDGGSGGGRMSQVFLDDAQIDTTFKQMGGPGMSQGMDGGWFGDAAFVEGGLEGALDSACFHGIDARLKRRWEEPNRIAMGDPILAQHFQDGFWQGNIAVFSAFPMADVQQEAVAVDVGDLQVQSFLQAQPTSIDRVQAGSVVLAAYAPQDTAHFGYAEHNWQFLLPGWAHQLEGFPFPAQSILEEELDPAQGKRTGAACSMFFVLEEQKILTQFFFVDLVWRFMVVPS